MADLPENVKALAAKADALYDKEQWDQCILTCTELLALVEGDASIPSNVKAAIYNNRGNAYNKIGNFDSALADFQKSLGLNPNYANTYNGRGVVYRDKGEFDKAIADFDKALELQSDLAGAYNNRGNVYFSQDEYDRAITDYDQAIKIDPKNTTSTRNRAIAIALQKSKKDQEAILKQHEKQLSKLREEFDAKIEKKISEYDINLLRIEEYTARQNEYKQEAKETGESIKKRFACLQWYAGVVFALIAIGIACAFWQKLSIIPILPLITAAGLCSGPFIWQIRTLKKNKAILMALSQDAYTKGILQRIAAQILRPPQPKRKRKTHHRLGKQRQIR